MCVYAIPFCSAIERTNVLRHPGEHDVAARARSEPDEHRHRVRTEVLEAGTVDLNVVIRAGRSST
jgi:hypothetical protein